jgi:hypothetical protein
MQLALTYQLSETSALASDQTQRPRVYAKQGINFRQPNEVAPRVCVRRILELDASHRDKMRCKLTLTGMLLNFLPKPTIDLSRPLKTRTGIIIRYNCPMVRLM